MRTSTILAAGLCLCVSPPGWAEEPPPPERALDSQAIAQSLDQSGNAQAAVDILRARINGENATADDFIQLAGALHKAGAHEEAVQTLLKARQKFPSNTYVIYQLGRSYIQAENSREAVNTMDLLIAMEPDNAMAYNAKGVAFDKAGNHFAAQEIYGLGLAVSPGSVPLQNNMAMSFILDGRPDEALTLLERLHKEAGEHPKVRHNLALAYGLTGNHDKALALGLQDLSEEQVKENLKFYEHYASAQKQNKSVDLLTQDDQVIVDNLQTEQVPQPEGNLAATTDNPKDSVDVPVPAEEPVEHEIQQAEEPAPDELSPAAGDETGQLEAPEEQNEDAAEPEQNPFGADAEFTYPGRNRRLAF
ncbi:MAG: tetratricopeptide repeat protein [Alphaproteobacteria bacterium]